MSPSRSTGAKLARTLMLLISTAIVGGAFACIAAQRDETAARPPQTPQVVHYFNRLGTPFIEYRPTASHFYTGYNLEYGLYGKAAAHEATRSAAKRPIPNPTIWITAKPHNVSPEQLADMLSDLDVSVEFVCEFPQKVVGTVPIGSTMRLDNRRNVAVIVEETRCTIGCSCSFAPEPPATGSNLFGSPFFEYHACSSCHGPYFHADTGKWSSETDKAPPLEHFFTVAHKRIPGMTAEEYAAFAITEHNAHVVGVDQGYSKDYDTSVWDQPHPDYPQKTYRHTVLEHLPNLSKPELDALVNYLLVELKDEWEQAIFPNHKIETHPW